jgi:L-iditol 2-dehydrogenase
MSANPQVDPVAIPTTMKAWVLGEPGELSLVDKPVPRPGAAEVLIRIDAVAICATDLEVIAGGTPALIEGDLPFNKNFTPGHEFMGTIVELGSNVDEYAVGERVAVEIHAGCGRCERCREGMYTSCLNYGNNYPGHDKGHRANGYTTDGAFTQFAVNHVNTLVRVPEGMSDETATLIVTAGTAMYGLDVLGGLIAGQSIIVTGGGPIGLLAVAVAKALGASPVILSDLVDTRLELGRKLGADCVINAGEESVHDVVMGLTDGVGLNYAFECSGAPNAINDVIKLVKRGGRVCLGAFAHEPVPVDVRHVVSNNIYLYGIRGEGKSAVRRAAALMAQDRFDAGLIHTHTFPLSELQEGLRYAREKLDGAIKIVIKNQEI